MSDSERTIEAPGATVVDDDRVQLYLRVSAVDAERVREAARREDRPVAAWLRRLVLAALKGGA